MNKLLNPLDRLWMLWMFHKISYHLLALYICFLIHEKKKNEHQYIYARTELKKMYFVFKIQKKIIITMNQLNIWNEWILTYFIEIERKFAGNGTVQSGFEISGPVLWENILSSCIFFANSRHSGINAFTAVDVFYGGFSKEEQNVFADIKWTNEIRLCKKKKNLFLCENPTFSIHTQHVIVCFRWFFNIIQSICTILSKTHSSFIKFNVPFI